MKMVNLGLALLGLLLAGGCQLTNPRYSYFDYSQIERPMTLEPSDDGRNLMAVYDNERLPRTWQLELVYVKRTKTPPSMAVADDEVEFKVLHSTHRYRPERVVVRFDEHVNPHLAHAARESLWEMAMSEDFSHIIVLRPKPARYDY